MTDKEFMTWIEDFLVDVSWTPAVRKKISYMITALDSREIEVMVPVPEEKVIVKHIIKYQLPDGTYRGYDEDEKKDVKIENLLIMVASKHKMTVDQMIGRTRKKEYVDARAEFVAVARGYSFSFRQIAEAMNRKNHATAIHAYRYRKGAENFVKFGHGKRYSQGTTANSGEAGSDGQERRDTKGTARIITKSGFQGEVHRSPEVTEQATEKLSVSYVSNLL